jgi:hypothetical protein
MEMLQAQMDRSSFELRLVQEWKVTQEKEGGRRRRRWRWRWMEVEVEQALVVVYARLRPCPSAWRGGGRRQGVVLRRLILYTEPVISCVFLHYDPF